MTRRMGRGKKGFRFLGFLCTILVVSSEMIELTPNVDSPCALFLDRDGTLIEDRGNNGDPAQVALIPGAAEGLELALLAGYRLFLLTNQGGVGLGLFSETDVEAVHSRMFELLGIPEGLFTEICVATEAPPRFAEAGAAGGPPKQSTRSPFARPFFTPFEPIVISQWRKPSPRFLLESIERYQLDRERCFLVGDRETDWRCGLAAGVQPVAVRTGAEITPDHEYWLTENHIPLFRQFYSFARTL